MEFSPRMCDIINRMPVQEKFSDDDACRIAQYRQVLLALEPQIIRGFYEIVYPRKSVSTCAYEHQEHSETLTQWWRRTLNGEFDTGYWLWHALVEIQHRNQVRSGAQGFIWDWLQIRLTDILRDTLSPSELAQLQCSFARLGATVHAFAHESYYENYLDAICGVDNLRPDTMEWLVHFKTENQTARPTFQPFQA